jgi:pseudaminic acid cytidylyltransferase
VYKQYKIVALICCRGGSKGIPEKNTKAFAGKPLLGWILEAAKEAGVFDEIILSTDSNEIAKIGQSYGVTIPGLRPAHLAQDKSDQFDTHKYIFELLNITDETHRVCNLTNNPFIDAKIIEDGYKASISVDFEHVVLDSVKVDGDYVCYRQCFQRDKMLHFSYPESMLDSGINRQAISPVFTSINNTRWAKPSVLASYENYKANIVSNGFIPIWLPKIRNFDLDDFEDWIIAESVFKAIVQVNHSKNL